MPVNRAAIFQLTLLLLIVPIQYIITQWKPVSDTERSHNLQNLMVKISSWKNKVLSIKTWKQCYENALKYVTGSFEKYAYPDIDEDDTDLGESPAVEVLRYKDKTGHFAASTEPRSPRSRKVKYRIGQVIRHKTWGYRGVIVGWDERAKAPEDWIKQMHGIHKHWRHMPSYSVLVDTRDRMEVQSTYVVEENIEIIRNTKIVHPEVQDYFEKFDGTRYLARPWLKQIYPHDQ
ncbi:F-box only protein 21-like isoform X1 [Patiria miniata]|uniref:Hemimethylated DNA-binding domain-containing protein n=1 Tax=Patiria miniata TaxID=46514 RepID=A0A914BTF9_PATMI|nr:F-box only protein 21-like isoform X1 [Patiria miniata]